MQNKEIEDLLKNLCREAYEHGENTGDYGMERFWDKIRETEISIFEEFGKQLKHKSEKEIRVDEVGLNKLLLYGIRVMENPLLRPNQVVIFCGTEAYKMVVEDSELKNEQGSKER